MIVNVVDLGGGRIRTPIGRNDKENFLDQSRKYRMSFPIIGTQVRDLYIWFELAC